MVVDGTGFKEHFNHGLGMHITDRRQYREELKKRNLIEAGNDKPDFSRKITPTNYADNNELASYLCQEHKFTDSDIKQLKDTNAE